MLKRTFFPTIAAAVLLSSGVFAQTPPSAPGSDRPPPASETRPASGVEHRLQRLHDRIGITLAQQPQWDAVVATLRDNAQALRSDPAARAVRSGTLTASQELRAISDLTRQRADAMQRMIPPMDQLYAALSPEQRQVADQEITKMMHRRPG